MTMTVDDHILFSGNPVRVPLPVGYHQLVHVFTASAQVPYVVVNLRTHAKVEQVVTALSTVHHDGSYVVPTTVDIGEL
jgi:hypothetical protein